MSPREQRAGVQNGFLMYHTKGMTYVLFDLLHEKQDEILVLADIVQYGDMISWYKSHLVHAYEIPYMEQPHPLAKDLMASFIEEYLEDGFNDEFCKVAKRFTVSYKIANVFCV